MDHKTWPDVAFELVFWIGICLVLFTCSLSGGFHIKLKGDEIQIPSIEEEFSVRGDGAPV